MSRKHSSKEPNPDDLTDSDYNVLEAFNIELENARKNNIPLIAIRAQYKDLYCYFPYLVFAFDNDNCCVRNLARRLTIKGVIKI